MIDDGTTPSKLYSVVDDAEYNCTAPILVVGYGAECAKRDVTWLVAVGERKSCASEAVPVSSPLTPFNEEEQSTHYSLTSAVDYLGLCHWRWRKQ